ncbi:uncharacterized protein LOC124645775 isoform X1 [Helicoverpa zea]|uniref:uncharacterized protein LOC124645775 isoform X1 n=1 Tax=Helicoverpa zea TaxID=7113 RepID=UPI001F560BBC|nr:uncharacterized protein LOC124645775 isoform X1 [Helicoverpa zea]
MNLCVLNDGSATRRVSPTQNASVPDLSFASPTLVSILSWSVLPNSYGSDHFPILITFHNSFSPNPPIQPLQKYRLLQADWGKFSSLVDSELHTLPQVNSSNSHDVYENFVSSLKRAADASIPLKNSARKFISSPPWWDAECTDSVRKRREAEIRYASSINMTNYLDLKKTSARTCRLLAKKKKSGWHNFCESLSPRSPVSIVWKRIKAYRRVLDAHSSDISSNDSSCWLEDFISKLAPPSVPSFECLSLSDSPPPSSDKFDEPFSLSELSCALDHLRDSAPGVDGIPYSFICKSSSLCKQILLNLFNSFFLSGVVPESWKCQIIIPILKPGKNPKDSSSYRPIALSSVLAKIMENLIKNRLEWFLESKGILSPSQFGFRRGMGTLDSLSIFVSDVRIAFSKNESVVGVFLDVASAYDNVQLPLLRQKMHQLSVPVRLVNIICNMLMSRTITIRHQHSVSPSRLVWKGLPQGSVLSPILYNLYTHDLESSVNCFCKILQYADDIALYYSFSSPQDASSRLNSALYYLNQWLCDHGLSLSVPKCNAVVFSRKRNIPPINLSIDNVPISTLDKIKFLGIILDSKLSGLHHLEYISKKCEKGVNALRALSGVRWGAHPSTQRILYNAIIRSHFDYGSFLLEPCNKIALAKLDKIQAKCLRIITGAMKCSPINALQVECLDPPLNLRRQYLSDRFFFKALQIKSHPLLPLLKTLHELIASSRYWSHKLPPPLINSYSKVNDPHISLVQSNTNPLFEVSFETLLFQPKVILSLGISKHDPGANNKLNKILTEDWQDWLTMYTDASKISEDGIVGTAVWIPKYKIILSNKVSPHSSIYTGESIALLEAVKYVDSHSLNKTLILSDSLSCLQDLIKFPFRARHNFPIILQIKQLLFKCHSSGIQVTLAWIPSHSGIVGNDNADSLAKVAIRNGDDSYLRTCFPRDLCCTAKPSMMKSWDSLWQKTRKVKALQSL